MANSDLTRIVTAAALARAAAEAEARRTLAATDWMVIRSCETGTPVPEDVTRARAAARRMFDAE